MGRRACEHVPHTCRCVLRVYGIGILSVAVLPVALLVLTPDGWSLNRLTVWIWTRLVYDIGAPVAMLPEHIGIALNVALFLPLGLGIGLVIARWWSLVILVAVSVAIELVQLTLIPTRSAEFGDVFANSLGACLGVAAALGTVRWCEASTRTPPGRKPTRMWRSGTRTGGS